MLLAAATLKTKLKSHAIHPTALQLDAPNFQAPETLGTSGEQFSDCSRLEYTNCRNRDIETGAVRCCRRCMNDGTIRKMQLIITQPLNYTEQPL